MRDYSGRVIGARPKARLVDAEQEPHEYDEHMSEKLTGVPKFVLPHSHSEYTIEPSPSASSLSDLKSRWVLLKQKVIAHKSHDGWRIGKVWKQGMEKKYGGMIWVTYWGGTNRGGHDFDPKDYGEDKMWVVLTAPIKSSKTK